MYSSVTSVTGMDRPFSISVMTGWTLQVSHAVNFPTDEKNYTLSHPVKAWKANRAFALWGPRAEAIL